INKGKGIFNNSALDLQEELLNEGQVLIKDCHLSPFKIINNKQLQLYGGKYLNLLDLENIDRVFLKDANFHISQLINKGKIKLLGGKWVISQSKGSEKEAGFFNFSTDSNDFGEIITENEMVLSSPLKGDFYAQKMEFFLHDPKRDVYLKFLKTHGTKTLTLEELKRIRSELSPVEDRLKLAQGISKFKETLAKKLSKIEADGEVRGYLKEQGIAFPDFRPGLYGFDLSVAQAYNTFIQKLDDIILKINEIYTKEKITLDTIDLLDFIEKHLFASELLTLNVQEDFELTRDLDFSNNNVFLTAPSFTNPEFIFKTKSFKGRFKKLFKVGNSNEKMGTVATCQGGLDVESDEVDNRYGKIFARGKGRLVSLVKDLRVGDYVEGPQCYAGPESAPYKSRSTNNAQLSSDGDLEIFGPNIHLNYASIFGKKVNFNASATGKVNVVSSTVLSQNQLFFRGLKTHITRDEQHVFRHGCSNASHSYSVVRSHEISPESIVQSLTDVHFESLNVTVEVSTLLASNSIYQRKNIIASKDKKFSASSSFELLTRACQDNHSGCGNICSGRTSCGYTPAKIQAGEAITVNTGAVTLEGGIHGYTVKINANTLITNNPNLHRDDSTPQVNLVLDMQELIKNYFSKEGFIKALDDGRLATDQPISGGFAPSPNQMVLTRPTSSPTSSPTAGPTNFPGGFAGLDPNNPESFFIHGVPLEFLFQNVLADYLGKLNIKGVTGRNLLSLLHNNAGDVLNDARASRAQLQDPTSKETSENSQLLTESDLKAATKSFITYMAKEIAGQVRLAATLVLNPTDINTYTQVGDIVSDLSTTITTQGSQTHKNSRIISGGDITLESLEEDLNFVTGKYTTQAQLDKNTVQTKEHLMPKMQVISKNGSIIKKAKGAINETAADTIAPKGYVSRESEQGEILIKDETLKTTTTTTTSKRNWMGNSKTTTESSTSYEHVSSTTVGGLGVFNRAKNQTIMEKGSKVSSEKEIVYEAKKILLS
ncbi:MAG TPA: hypothetical protein VI959_00880, partial [Alphaproteobacteria bacterium]|nr:hypothetical protein [Alphaproteobacteria bacterium]